MEKKITKKHLIIGIPTFILVIATIVLCCVFIPKACQKKEPTQFKLDVSCTNSTVDNQTELHNFYPENDVVTLTFKANDNYSLPEDIKATSGNKQLVKGTDYTYSAASGEFTFTITGDTEVNCEAFSNTELRFEVKIPANKEIEVGFMYDENKTPWEYDYPGTVDWGDGTTNNKLSHRYPKTSEEKTYIATAKDYNYEYFRFYQGSGYSSFNEIVSVTLPTSIKTLGYNAFLGCSFTSITLPSGINKIEDYAFNECRLLKSLSIPGSVTSIGDSAFNYCDSLQFNEKDNAKYLGNESNNYYALIKYSDYSITSCTIDSGCKIIASAAFHGCYSLSSISIPNSVISIGKYAFGYCTNVSSIVIPNSVSLMDEEVFPYWESSQTINCEAPSKPDGWNNNWNSGCTANIVWNYHPSI